MTPESIFDDVGSHQLPSDEHCKVDGVIAHGEPDATNADNGNDVTDDDESRVVPGSELNRVKSRDTATLPLSASSVVHLDSSSADLEVVALDNISGQQSSTNESSSSSAAVSCCNQNRYSNFIRRLSTATMDPSSPDDRKRPLSTSSTSSTSIASSSASSSLSRHHQRKKMATTTSHCGGESVDDELVLVDCRGCAQEEDEEEEPNEEADTPVNGCLSTVTEFFELTPTTLVASVTEIHSAAGDKVAENATAHNGDSFDRVQLETDCLEPSSDRLLTDGESLAGNSDLSCVLAIVEGGSRSDAREVDIENSYTAACGKDSTGSSCGTTTTTPVGGRCDATNKVPITSAQTAPTSKDSAHCSVGVTMSTGSAGAGGGSGSSSAGLLRQVLSQSQYINCVLSEIVDTERAYINDLRQIIEVCTQALDSLYYIKPEVTRD